MKINFSRRQLLQSIPLLFLMNSGKLFAGKTGNLSNKKLVIIELSGGNDGLNTLIPYTNDTYYKLRKKISIPKNKVLKIDDDFGFNPGMTGFKRLYDQGNVSIIHGCGYENPSYSHFTSMSYWHTGYPNSGQKYGWLGRLADVNNKSTFNVNINSAESLAVKSKFSIPIVFDNPNSLIRKKYFEQRSFLKELGNQKTNTNKNLEFLNFIAKKAREASMQINTIVNNFPKNTDYGILPLGLDNIAALIDADYPATVFYTSFRNNAFDTHIQQNNLHERLLTYFSDAVSGFQNDLKKINKEDEVITMVFSEFGRRVPENTSLGTDHGTANHVYIVGSKVNGGHYEDVPNLDDLDDGDNLKHTTDFRRIYATLIDNWLKSDSKKVLGKNFDKIGFI